MNTRVTSAAEFKTLLGTQFKTIKSAGFTKGAGAMFYAEFGSKKEAEKCAIDFQIATKAKSCIRAIFEEIDIFDENGELVDIEYGQLVGYRVTNCFG